MKRPVVPASMLLEGGLVPACTPEVGSGAWCEAIGETPSDDWTANQATDFVRLRLLKAPRQGQALVKRVPSGASPAGNGCQ